MLYSEFIENTGCKDTENNYNVYKGLEHIYMTNDSMTKETVYVYGKELVDNSKTEREIEIENNIKSEIAKIKEEIEYNKLQIERYREIGDKRELKLYKNWNTENRNKIKSLKSLFNV